TRPAVQAEAAVRAAADPRPGGSPPQAETAAGRGATRLAPGEAGKRRSDDRPEDRAPWRVEGAPQNGERSKPPDWRRLIRRLWWLVLVVLVVNWVVATMLLSPQRATVSYTFFRQQVQAGNVTEITSTGDTIQGQLRNPVKYPLEDPKARKVTRFATQRPAFADDQLVQLLLQKNVTVNANPP